MPWADLDFARRPDGAAHQSYVILPCPVPGCDSASVHPVSGGADREGVRGLFAAYYQRRAAALGLDADTPEKARALVAERADELERRR